MMAQRTTAPVQGYCNPGNAGYPQQPQPVRQAPPAAVVQPSAELQKASRDMVAMKAALVIQAIEVLFKNELDACAEIARRTKGAMNSPGFADVKYADHVAVRTGFIRPLELFKKDGSDQILSK